jgi:choice-of-anchor B domain-containing protein
MTMKTNAKTTAAAGVGCLWLLAASCGRSLESPAAPPATLAPAVPPDGPNMELLAHLDTAALEGSPRLDADVASPSAGARLTVAGCWGYTSPSGRRLALTGTSLGLSIVDVTEPRRPRNLGLIPGPASSWREVKTYRGYAYVTTEAEGWGLDVVDLRDPDRPRRVRTWNETFARAHTLWIDEARGLLFANGVRGGHPDRPLQSILDLAGDPASPREVGGFGAPSGDPARDVRRYIHDCYVRGTTLYGAAIQDGSVAIYDVADPAHAREIGHFRTGGLLTHNMWLTDDGRHLFTTEEMPGMPVKGWDISDAQSPRQVSAFIAAPSTTPHNVMIDGSRLLVAHYTEGVHLLDIRDPARPVRLGHYDTYPGGSSGDYRGAWGAYIFPGSDLIIASDIDGGLFVLRYTGPR